MIPLEYELSRLKGLYQEMVDLVRAQVASTKDALVNNHHITACEVMKRESRVNFYETTIDKECEDFLALHRPVASDLRFAIAVIKMSGNLERIGDHAYRVCSFMCDEQMELNEKIIEQVKLSDLFNELDQMMINVQEAFEKKDVKIAQKVFKQDKLIDKVNKKIPKIIEKYLKKNKQASISNLILVSRAVGKLERTGDLIKNIAEEIVFYLESDVIKHRKKNKKIRKRFNVVE